MSLETDLERTLRSRLDAIELGPDIPTAVARRALSGRRTKLAALSLGIALFASLALIGVLRVPTGIDIAPVGPDPIPFERLPVRGAARVSGLVSAPVAPPQFPDCTGDTVDISLLESSRPKARLTFMVQAREGVQCGLDWWPGGIWSDDTGQVYQPPRAGPSRGAPIIEDVVGELPADPLLLMGTGATEYIARVGPACELEAPITYSIMLADEAVEVGTIDDPRCTQGRAAESPYSYERPGLETPMALLDPHIEDVQREAPGVLGFILRLVNDTDETIVVGRCPFYDVSYVTSEGSTRLRSYLNCPAAPDEVEPGEAIRFSIEMSLREPGGPGRLNLTLRDERRPLHRLHEEVAEL